MATHLLDSIRVMVCCFRLPWFLFGLAMLLAVLDAAPSAAGGYLVDGWASPPGEGSAVSHRGADPVQLSSSHAHLEVYSSWLGMREKAPSLTKWLRPAAVILLALLALSGAALIWTWLLRREMARRTQALRTTEVQFRSLIEGAPDAVFVQTHQRFAYVNQAACKLFGAKQPDELVGTPVMDRFHPSVHALVHDRIADLNTRKQPVPAIEEVYLKLDGSEVPTEVSAVPVTFGDDDGALVFARDISKRKRTERRIEHLHRVLRGIRDINRLIVREHDRARLIAEGCRILVNHRGYLSAVMIVIDEAGQLVDWTEAGIEDLESNPVTDRLQRGELPPCCAVAPAEDRLTVVEQCAHHSPCETSGPHARDGSIAICAHLVHANTAVGYLIVSVQPELFAAEGERQLLVELADDLAYAIGNIRHREAHLRSEHERQALILQLSQAQKMEAVGRLAGGVAHDFNNNLTVILGYVEMALMQTSTSDRLHRQLTEIQKAAARSADLTRQLLAFARRQAVTPHVLDPNETIEAMLGMLGRLIGEEIDLVWTPGDRAYPVRMDPAQIDQVLANLVVNARDAIDGIGAVSMKTENVRIDAAFCDHADGLEPGDYLLLTVSDTGSGMDQDTLQSVFEPFFTTKPAGQGTGLGLSTVYGIVKQNGGAVSVASAPGEGTTFRIYLPCAAVDDYAGPSESGATTTRGRESILLVEDEEPLLELTSEVLEGLGYTVYPAATPTQALWLARQHGENLQLLLTDVVMPEMNGREMWQKLQEVCPDLPCLFMSGYTADVIADRGIIEDGVHFIGKPFTEQALAAAVRAALESS